MEYEQKLLKPKYDVVFRALFGENNKRLAEVFISDILGQKVKIQDILDRHLNIKVADQKLGIMDYRAILDDNTYCNIEIQLQEQEYEIERFLYYLADTYSRQLSKGEEYGEIHKTISIVIVDHEIDKLKEFEKLNVKWQMRDNITGVNLLTDKFEMCIIELPKARRIYEKKASDKVCDWMMFLDDPNSQEVSKIMEKDKDIKVARNMLKYLSKDEEIRRIAELKEKARRDANAAASFNVKKGAKQKSIEVAKKMLNENMDIAFISKITELTKKEILELK